VLAGVKLDKEALQHLLRRSSHALGGFVSQG
jgi:hypothetical protein